ncbi:MAG TPA: thiolase family protein [Burkholderiaceae bacterium]|nr:thiolase family protein [Burkholderiaceae bacterium]HMZ00812.1 thiolase family protein [Burkholderiaceae bacterium]HNB45535.1 thiolase family protein [Burkholderiaceae bacterium]HNG78137.1 thiolase family protein [Burkholderiaceae bacterium]
MGLQGKAALVGAAQYKPEKYMAAPRMFHLEQVADLATLALADAGLSLADVDGLVTTGPQFHEAGMFVPAMAGEYLGVRLNFAEVVDLGGASSVAMVWRAAAAIELGLCDTVVCVIPARMAPASVHDDHVAEVMRASRFGGHSTRWGAPEAELDLPYGHMAQNTGYAMIAQRYAATHGYDAAALARICVDQRFNACHNPDAMFFGQPITVDDVLNSRMVAEPLRMLEIVMPVAGGGALVLTRADKARGCRHRAVRVVGCGEHVHSKSPTYAADMLATPIGPASRRAFEMAGCRPADVHMAQIYDCYTITVLLTLEDAGFCPKGEGLRFLREHDFTFKGDFPMNTHGGQLSFGQTGSAGGMTQVIEAMQQIQGRAGARQLHRHDLAYVSGTGGVMSEQGALILKGDE